LVIRFIVLPLQRQTENVLDMMNISLHIIILVVVLLVISR